MGAVIINRLGSQLVCGIMLVAYASASIVWTSANKSTAVCWLASMVGAFMIGYAVEPIRRIWLGAIIFAITVFVLNWLTSIDLNPNYLGVLFAFTLAGAIAYGYWLAIPVLLFAVYTTQSRTALVGAGIACLIGLWNWSRFWAISLALIAILFILHQKSDGALSLWSRLGIWQDTMEHFTPFGHGLGSFLSEYSQWPVRRNMTLQLAPHAYNDIIELIFELGVGAILLWALIFLAWENHNPVDKLICLVFFALGLTHFPLSIPLVAHLFAMTLGHLSNPRYERKYYGRMSTMEA